MRKTTLLLLIAVFSMGLSVAFAQDDTGTETESTEPETTVEIFFVACEDEGVMNLTGVAQPGFDIFYQLYKDSTGSGTALTSLRRINAEGDYAFSERIAYSNGERVAPGAIASARIIVAEIETPDNPAFETFVDDVQDGCNDASNNLQSSDDAGDPVEEDEEDTFGIASPDGGFLGSAIVEEEPVVVIGPRTSDAGNRTTRPGLVFALCDNFYPDAEPGILYDSDNLRIYWYWFADTAETLEQNLSVTEFRVNLNSVPVNPTSVLVSPVTERNGVFYRFYTANIGNVRPGFYFIDFKQDWSQPINDGFDDYGPGTANPAIRASCNFQVVQNPFGLEPRPSGVYLGVENPPSNYQRAIIETQVEGEFIESFSGN